MIRKIGITTFVLFLLVNAVAFQHAYRFTHFSQEKKERTRDPEELSAITKARILFTGIDNPKPKHSALPKHSFNTVHIRSDVQLEAWHIQAPDPKGTVILFHGYAGEKSSLITRAEEFLRLGYNTLLVDFMGSGGSEGESTNLGFTESIEVRDCFEYLRALGETRIHLFGTSMGAAAILKAVDDYRIKPASLILECPFGSLYKTVSARFKIMNVPTFPFAAMLTFWGGFQQGYWAFSHNPSDYAESVQIPTLLMYGDRDNRVSVDETLEIFDNLKGEKVLARYPEEGHHIFTEANQEKWIADVTRFLLSVERSRTLDATQ